MTPITVIPCNLGSDVSHVATAFGVWPIHLVTACLTATLIVLGSSDMTPAAGRANALQQRLQLSPPNGAGQ